MNDKDKIEALERIIKAITYADEIRYPKNPHKIMLERIQFVGANPDHLYFRGYSEGLEIDWDAEYYEDEVPEELGGGITMSARLIGEVWIQEDLWKTVQDLKQEIQSLSESASDRNDPTKPDKSLRRSIKERT